MKSTFWAELITGYTLILMLGIIGSNTNFAWNLTNNRLFNLVK